MKRAWQLTPLYIFPSQDYLERHIFKTTLRRSAFEMIPRFILKTRRKKGPASPYTHSRPPPAESPSRGGTRVEVGLPGRGAGRPAGGGRRGAGAVPGAEGREGVGKGGKKQPKSKKKNPNQSPT